MYLNHMIHEVPMYITEAADCGVGVETLERGIVKQLIGTSGFLTGYQLQICSSYPKLTSKSKVVEMSVLSTKSNAVKSFGVNSTYIR